MRKRLSWGSLLLAACLAAAFIWSPSLLAPQPVDAARDERTISLYEIHLKETTTVTFKRDGKFLPEGLKKLNWALRDWRRNTPTKMNPKLIDLVWKIHKASGSREPIHVISGYRSPKTNRMLRRTRGGQAKRSQHMLGNAMDVHFPDVPMSKIRELAFQYEVGGVGYYPTSAIPFVHIDTARVRSWPRMPRRQLAMLFPDRPTRHRPARGGPLTKRDRAKARVRLAALARKKKQQTLLAQSGPSDSMGADKPARASVVASLDTRPFSSLDVPGADRHQKNLWFYKMDGSSDLQAELKQAKAEERQLAQMRPLQPQTVAAPAAAPAARPAALANKAQGPSMRDKLQLASLTAPLAEGFNRVKAHASRLWINNDGNKLPESVKRPAPRLAATNEARPAANADTATGAPAGYRFAEERVAYAPAFDEEHPDELSYRPFKILPLISGQPIIYNTRLVALQEPKHERVLELLSMSENLPMQFRPSAASAQMRWLDQFRGEAILNLRKRAESTHSMQRPTRVAARR